MNPSKDSNLPATTGSNMEKPTNGLDQTQNFRPSFAPKATARQLCMLVLDASGSMKSAHYGGHTKAVAANEAAQGLIHRLKTSSRRANFQVGIINFDTEVIVRQLPTPVTEMDHTAPVLEIDDLGSATDIGEALQEAYSIAEAFLSQQQPGGLQHAVVILLMSDGICCYPDETRSIAERIKVTFPIKKLKVATALFEGFAGQQNQHTADAIELLEEIASTDAAGMPCFLHTSSPEALRRFFEASSGVA